MERGKLICKILKAEMRLMEQQFRKRQLRGKVVALAGISAGIIALPGFGSNSYQHISGFSCNSSQPIPGGDCDFGQATANGVALEGEPAELHEETMIIDGDKVTEGAATPAEMTDAPTGDRVADVCDDVDTQPEFPGGTTAMLQFLAANIRYPSVCDDVQGRVIVRFLVDSTGTVGNPEIIKSEVTKDYNEEVIRVVQLMPKFKPAEKDGKPVDAWFTMPITFRLSL